MEILPIPKPGSPSDHGKKVERRSIRLLPLMSVLRVWPEYDFSIFAKFLRALCRQMRASVSESVSRPRVDV